MYKLKHVFNCLKCQTGFFFIICYDSDKMQALKHMIIYMAHSIYELCKGHENYNLATWKIVIIGPPPLKNMY